MKFTIRSKGKLLKALDSVKSYDDDCNDILLSPVEAYGKLVGLGLNRPCFSTYESLQDYLNEELGLEIGGMDETSNPIVMWDENDDSVEYHIYVESEEELEEVDNE